MLIFNSFRTVIDMKTFFKKLMQMGIVLALLVMLACLMLQLYGAITRML